MNIELAVRENRSLHLDYHYHPVYKTKEGNFISMINYYGFTDKENEFLMKSVKAHLKFNFNLQYSRRMECFCPNCESYYLFLKKKKQVPDNCIFERPIKKEPKRIQLRV